MQSGAYNVDGRMSGLNGQIVNDFIDSYGYSSSVSVNINKESIDGVLLCSLMLLPQNYSISLLGGIVVGRVCLLVN